MKPIEQKAIDAFHETWVAWNGRKEETIEQDLRHWGESVRAIGTAADEIWRGRKDYIAYSKRAFEQMSDPFRVEAIWLEASHLTGEYVLIWGAFKIIVDTGATPLIVEPIRFTGVMHDRGDHMEYVQWHASVPDAAEGDEIWVGTGEPRRYEEVSVFFSDFVGFTNIVAAIPAKKLVSELRDLFGNFDRIIGSEGLEKIKTIGDAYLAVCGLPKEDPDHAVKCVSAARKIIKYLEERNKNKALKWEARIGIHSGPVTAGVMVGGKSNKFAYDIFGDTVNTASRIETAGEKGKINVSAYTFELIKHQFKGEYRGKINVKGKGPLDMYFVV